MLKRSLIMEDLSWKPPSWRLPLDEVDGIEVFRVKDSISQNDWPTFFWNFVRDRTRADPEESKALVSMIRDLEVGEPARCHHPPYGIAGYSGDRVVFTSTFCFECANAYIHTIDGKELRAFRLDTPAALNLKETLDSHFKVKRRPAI